MRGTQAANAARHRAAFTTSFARTITDLRRAQRLRYRVFAQEMGACVPGRDQGIDGDIFDAYCDHLIARDTATGEVVGTYRLLPWMRARRAGSFYSQGEFDLSHIAEVLPHTVEAGRACVHPEYRGSAVLAQLWAAIVDYVRSNGARYLIGCASVSLADCGMAAHAVRDALRHAKVPSPAVSPRRPYRFRPHASGAPHALPELAPPIRSYIRLGASVCESPAWDPQFNTADYFVLLPMARLNGRYARRFAGRLPNVLSPTAG